MYYHHSAAELAYTAALLACAHLARRLWCCTTMIGCIYSATSTMLCAHAPCHEWRCLARQGLELHHDGLQTRMKECVWLQCVLQCILAACCLLRSGPRVIG